MNEELLTEMRDVTPLPGFPGAPSLTQWLLLLLAVLLLAGLSTLIALRPWRRRPQVAILREGLRQAEILRRELPHREVREGAARLGTELRRLLTVLSSQSFQGATGRMLEALVAAESAPARTIGELLIELDKNSFLPSWSSANSVALLGRLIATLEEGQQLERRKPK